MGSTLPTGSRWRRVDTFISRVVGAEVLALEFHERRFPSRKNPGVVDLDALLAVSGADPQAVALGAEDGRR